VGEGGSVQSQAGKAGSGYGGKVATGGASVEGGFTNTGGSGTSGSSTCEPLQCPRGYTPAPSPTGCNYACQPDPVDCETQRQTYAGYREAVLFKYAPYKCSSDAHCVFYYDKNECQAYSCGVIVDTRAWAALDQELNAFARMLCDPSCPPPPAPPCDPAAAPVCFRGHCE
jgi:hypothetical protein